MVALFGLGDQEGYGDEFVDAMIEIFSVVKAGGAKVVGFWPTDGYTFEASKSIVDGDFCGLDLELASNHLEALKGDRQSQYSIRINKHWRICFEWPFDAPGPVNVEIVDYH